MSATPIRASVRARAAVGVAAAISTATVLGGCAAGAAPEPTQTPSPDAAAVTRPAAPEGELAPELQPPDSYR
ncbi:hypothetical protein AB1K54_00330 [Microbacterium sp. BWT-B31]|uniref:hypothetical protein n=1 Tax=Microbacterium sp. BWT-B31 TaxID=3232072 RepID=UPI003527EC98